MKYLFVFAFLFASCIKESNTSSDTFFINETSHDISVLPYRNGIIDSNQTFNLAPHETNKVISLGARGLTPGMSFGEPNQFQDSFVVVFDNTYKIAHYKPAPIGNRVKRYLFSSDRNIFNRDSYKRDLITDKKHFREWDFEYTFTEQDYLDAK